MKRFYQDLINSNGAISVSIPSGKQCEILSNNISEIKHGVFGEPHFNIQVNGEHVSTISKRWDWDDFVKEFAL